MLLFTTTLLIFNPNTYAQGIDFNNLIHESSSAKEGLVNQIGIETNPEARPQRDPQALVIPGENINIVGDSYVGGSSRSKEINVIDEKSSFKNQV